MEKKIWLCINSQKKQIVTEIDVHHTSGVAADFMFLIEKWKAPSYRPCSFEFKQMTLEANMYLLFIMYSHNMTLCQSKVFVSETIFQ